jgi:purine-binding chemotaxis protein CheW
MELFTIENGGEGKICFSQKEIKMTMIDEKSEQTDNAKSIGGKHLTFKLENEEYGIEILKIKEIIGIMPITTVPQTPDYVKGVINLRGKIIPVVDLRMMFGMATLDYSDRTCIVVVEIQRLAETVFVGLVVDEVSEVVNLNREDIEDSPEFSVDLDTNYILGLAKTEGGVKILLDIEGTLNTEEIGLAA